MIAGISRHNLQFKKPAGTSRGIYTGRDIWLLSIYNSNNPDVKGIGECAPLSGLSIDDRPDYEDKLRLLVKQINKNKADDFPFREFPSIKFGLETALLDLKNGGRKIIFQNFYAIGRQGIPINGLIWMDQLEAMKEEALEKIKRGFDCIKVKIGALKFEQELELLEFIRSSPGGSKLILRLDANGAFAPETALEKLNELKPFRIHSLEQPIRAGQREALRDICARSPIPIALDEELIGLFDEAEIDELLRSVKPQYLVFKPNLLGGFVQTDLWIKMAAKYQTGWWITSALESNIGLNAIAQYAAGFPNALHSGLGTGQLYTGNFTPYTRIDKGYLWRDMGSNATDLLNSPTEVGG